MTGEWRERVWDLFDRAADLPTGERAAFLDRACAGDAALRAEVESLLAHDAQPTIEAGDAGLFRSPVGRLPRGQDPPTRPFPAGAAPPRVGHYRVLRLLGEGGMGAVYEAEQDSPRRRVALKVVRPGLVSPALLKRFAHEAQILGRLRHPGIAQIHEAGVAEDGQPFFAMELIHGLPLDLDARRRGLDPAARLDLLARVCDAVQHAHEQGVIHRDLKPSNVLVDEAGQPKVLDFGVARATGADLAASTAHTRTGQLVGTLSYMSPEQVAADPAALDARSDVYTLGVILFELLAGRLPYALERLPLPEVARAIREQEPSRLGTLDTRLRGDVETIVAKALEKEPSRRYQSAAELAADVRRHLGNEPIRARPPSALYHLRKFARRHPALATAYALAAVAVFLGLGGGLAVWSWRTAEGLRQTAEDAQANAVRARQAEADAKEKLDQVLYLHRVQLAHLEWLNKDLARSRRLLQECPPERRHWEWRYVSRLNPLLLEVADPLGHFPDVQIARGDVQFSPDGHRLISMAVVGTIRVRDSETGEEVATLEGSAPASLEQMLRKGSGLPSQVALSPDGKVIAATRGQAVRIWDAGTGKLLRTLSWMARPGGGHVSCIAFSHDGRRLALGCDGQLRVWDAEAGREVFSLLGHKGTVSAVAFSADGRWLASGSGDHTVKLCEAATGRKLRTLRGHRGQVGSVAFTPDGGRLASAGADGTVKVWDPADGKLLLTLVGQGGSVHAVAFRPDGKLLAAGLDNGVVAAWDVATGREAFQLCKHPENRPPVTGLSFSPDGTRLASFGLDEAVRVWDATTPGEVRTIPLPLSGTTTTTVTLSRDGRCLVEGRSTGQVLVWEVGGQGVGPLDPRTLRGHQGGVDAAAISPDGRHVAALGADGTLRLWDAGTAKVLGEWPAHEAVPRGTTVFRITFPNGAAGGEVRAQSPAALARAVAFSPDGRTVATAGGQRLRGEVKLWDGDGRLLLDVRDHPRCAVSVAFSPDGRWLVSGDMLGTVKTRDVRKGEVLWERKVGGPAVSVAFRPDGRQVAASDPTRSRIHVWDAATGEEVQALTGGGDRYLGIQFSPDGRRLVSSSLEHTISLWDVATGQEALRLKGGSRWGGAVGVREAWFSADGSRLFSVGWQPTPAVKVWETVPLAGP